MIEKIFIHGFPVKYEKEDNVANGVKYLRDDLQREEALVFFDGARMRGSAQFETDTEEQYTLTYAKDGSYTLIRRATPQSFF